MRRTRRSTAALCVGDGRRFYPHFGCASGRAGLLSKLPREDQYNTNLAANLAHYVGYYSPGTGRDRSCELKTTCYPCELLEMGTSNNAYRKAYVEQEFYI